MKYVKKADGSLQPFDRAKVRRTLRNMGIAAEQADRIADEIQNQAYDGIETSTLLRMIRTRARAIRPAVANRTNLRRALALLRPKPDFEEFVRVLLRECGYQVEPGCILLGRCGEHEVDAIARNNGKVRFVEVKHHFNHHRMTGLDEGRIARAIVEDIQEGFRSGGCASTVDGAMIVCNTKLTEHAKRYADCWGIEHIGWDHPSEGNLQTMIEETQSYPITIVAGVSPSVRTKLVGAGILTAKQLVLSDAAAVAGSSGLSLRQVMTLTDRARSVMELKDER
jgi:hypothetical protein